MSDRSPAGEADVGVAAPITDGKAFDTVTGVAHPRIVLSLSRRASALVLILALASSNVALCAGWMATAEERMACCADRAACPMHTAHEAGSPLSQAQADSCCGVSESDESAPTASILHSAMSSAPVHTVIQLVEPPLVRHDARRQRAPVQRPSVPKHVLLSVFLV
jgi:hypothetical protein